MLTKPHHKSASKAKVYSERVSKQRKAPALIQMAEMMVLQGKYDKALQELESLQSLYGQSYRFNLVLARIYRDAGDLANAKHYYEKACQAAPQNEVAIRELIELLSEQKDAANRANQSDDPSLDLFLEETSRGLFTAEEMRPSHEDDFAAAPSQAQALPENAFENKIETDGAQVSEIASGAEPAAQTLFDESELSAKNLLSQDDAIEPESSMQKRELTADELFASENFAQSIQDEQENIALSDDEHGVISVRKAEPVAPKDEHLEIDSSDLLSENPSEQTAQPRFDTNVPDNLPLETEHDAHVAGSEDMAVPALGTDEELDATYLFTEDEETKAQLNEPGNSPSILQEAKTAYSEEADFPQEEPIPFAILGQKKETELADNKSNENVADLFLPEDQESRDASALDVSDLSRSTISSEALQREAIRMLEEEQGNISDDPFVDFYGKKPKLTSSSELFETGTKNMDTVDETELEEDQRSGALLFDEREVDENEVSESTKALLFDENEVLQSPETPQETVASSAEFTEKSHEPERAETNSTVEDSTEPATASEDIDIFSDDFEFTFDKDKLAKALSNLHSSGEKASKKTPDTKNSVAKVEPPASAKPQPAPPKSGQREELNIDELAQNLSKLNLPPIEETNDPTPISEQRQPFSDDEEIKTPSKSLAEIFVSQGAYTKAIRVYQALSKKNPNQAAEYAAAMEAILRKMKKS
ncbi:Tetratricopeptide TPR_2 repeat protein [Chloroherpeton thalassium ATCC 35110]|uniref:Tetratricopeptide TPR_2 repeat protein n=1 Tax=Chloroherpeton thalassium (strain ATCC 35110 / GB-78) TaxID=517418 RepID=B3QSI9_CHLT3|nr:tetratricopeptide repeat protein [Chloroherpeton thalassium]ACF14036.1 Tetratricopeptide TPR_2 repeat protein [Chloroherpeton thalassium ATCC 35110]